jgi:hypothetical protein
VAEEKKIKMVLLRDFWPEEDKRIAAGTVFEAVVDNAMDMLEKGIAKRADRDA